MPALPSRSHRTCTLYSVFLLFALAASAVPTVQHFRRPTLPANLSELAQRIQAAQPQWSVTSIRLNSDDLSTGFWLTKEKRSLPDLVGTLYSGHATLEDWRGALCCTIQEEPPPLLNDEQHHLRIGRMMVYGDPEMLSQIADLPRRHGL